MIEEFSGTALLNDPGFDVCVVGSGPAGMAVVSSLLSTNKRVLLLESGGDLFDPATEELSSFENVGHRRVPPGSVRKRIFGGTSTVWSGRCARFSELDFQRRDWMPHSGWPIPHEEVARFYPRAMQFLNAGPFIQHWQTLLPGLHTDGWSPSRLVTEVFQASLVNGGRTRQVPLEVDDNPNSLGALAHSGAPVAADIGESMRDSLARSGNVRVMLNAHVLRVNVDPAGFATGVVVAEKGGARIPVKARNVVLACGAIDNARLLLLSTKAHHSGLGLAADNFGRFLTDHHYLAVGSFGPSASSSLRRLLGQCWLDVRENRYMLTFGASLAPDIQSSMEIPRATLYSFEHRTRPHAISMLGRAARDLRNHHSVAQAMRSMLPLAAHPIELGQGLWDRAIAKQPSLAPIARLDIGCNVEQILQRESSVQLGEQRDKFDQPLARIDWRLDEREFKSYRVAFDTLRAESLRLGFGEPEMNPVLSTFEDWKNAVHDMAHPMCTTRMAGTPADGVVDSNCRVFGVDGLYVAGSSVFSSPGTANPTLLLVALALRLGEHIARSLNSTPFSGSERDNKGQEKAGPAQPSTNPVRVGVIGAGDRIRSVYQPLLTALSPRVIVSGFVTRDESRGKDLSTESGWTHYPSPEALVSESRPDFLLIAISDSANEGMLQRMIPFGLPILCETPPAWNPISARELSHKANRAGTPVGISEQFPFKPADCLRRKLIDAGKIGQVLSIHNQFATYAYHGIAQMRRHLNQGASPKRVHARTLTTRHHPAEALPHTNGRPAEETWQHATIEFSDGTICIQDYSSTYPEIPHRPAPSFRIFGTSGSIVDNTLILADNKNLKAHHLQFLTSRIAMPGNMEKIKVSVDLPSTGEISWESRAIPANLTDDQFAVLGHIESMIDTCRFGTAPLYTLSDAADDMLILDAIQTSATLGGICVPLRWSKLLKTSARASKLPSSVFRRIRGFKSS